MATRGIVLGLVVPLMVWVSRSAGVDFRFASYIDNNMVLQKEPAGAVIWGFGLPGATVMVTVYHDQQTVMKKVTRVRELSHVWMVVLDPMKPGGPFELMAEQNLAKMNHTLRIHDVLFGDVWLCSGQSNMQMNVSQIYNATKEMSNITNYQSVRIFSVSLAQAEQELEDLAGIGLPWSKPSSENSDHGNLQNMSAVCWLFGRYLYDSLQYPIGLIASSWGGTPIEAWSSERSLKTCGIRQQGVLLLDSVTGPSKPSVLWNAMIHPLNNMTLKGVIWYQGESNMNYNLDLYNCTFPALIEDWRQTFHYGSQKQTERFFPFGFVQLSSYLPQNSSEDGFPKIRWHQTADFGYAPNAKMPKTFMAVTMDLGDRHSPLGSIHPRDKQTVAYRLHLGARAVAYGEKNLIFQGPLPKKMEVLFSKRLLNLTYQQQIQVQRLDKQIFEISCCGDHQCKWLPAPMDTFSNWTLVLNISSCPGPLAALRYAWTTWPCEYKQCPLYHPTSTLPAPPFVVFLTN
ncbi:PREDICTED: sialate O-acetylesterase [Elephantulus edwardii]|uniref:sialate O-acetylesterase n=1 Tax=Elephantulus edwardii TaxID=28737 RepID=UPI0003F0C3EA|nr:PREDICTED: sialate O-acetylesterase [Elephantulus edwardii]